MTEIKVPDEGGDLITLADVDGARYSKFGHPVDHVTSVIRKLPQFEFRDGDVLLCSYPKAGCTWTFEILTMLLKGKPEGPEHSKMRTMLEASTENMAAFPSPRLLNTHLPYRRLPSNIRNKKVKIVFVIRNPKDLAVSLYNMMYGMTHYEYQGTFANWLPLFLRGELLNYAFTYPKYMMHWEQILDSKQHESIVLYYEDMKKDTLAEVKRLADFLDLDLADDMLDAITKKCQFDEMKTRHPKALMDGAFYRDGVKHGFMRKGEVGNWKNWFTVAQSENMDKIMDKQMAGSQLKLNIKYQL